MRQAGMKGMAMAAADPALIPCSLLWDALFKRISISGNRERKEKWNGLRT
jgi:hypothetical protein